MLKLRYNENDLNRSKYVYNNITNDINCINDVNDSNNKKFKKASLIHLLFNDPIVSFKLFIYFSIGLFIFILNKVHLFPFGYNIILEQNYNIKNRSFPYHNLLSVENISNNNYYNLSILLDKNQINDNFILTNNQPIIPIPYDINIVENNNNSIPNIVHFIYLIINDDLNNINNNNKRKFNFIQYLIIRAAYLRLNPDIIYFHTNKLNINDELNNNIFWKLTKSMITINIIKIPKMIFNNPIYIIQHASDIIRLQVLYKYGGIYLDTDIIILRSFKSILKNNTAMILGMEQPFKNNKVTRICNAIIIAKKSSLFLKKWINTYRTFNDNSWGSHSLIIPSILANIYPETIKLMPPEGFFLPSFTSHDMTLLFENYNKIHLNNKLNFTKNYAIHLWGKKSYKKYQANLTPYKIINEETALHMVLRPILPFPFITIIIDFSFLINKIKDHISSIKETLDSIFMQTFILYKIVLLCHEENDKILLKKVINENYLNQSQKVDISLFNNKTNIISPFSLLMLPEEKLLHKNVLNNLISNKLPLHDENIEKSNIADPYLLKLRFNTSF